MKESRERIKHTDTTMHSYICCILPYYSTSSVKLCTVNIVFYMIV